MKKLLRSSVFFILLSRCLLLTANAQNINSGDTYTRNFQVSVNGVKKQARDTIYFEKTDTVINVVVQSLSVRTIIFDSGPVATITGSPIFKIANANADTITPNPPPPVGGWSTLESVTFTIKKLGTNTGTATLNFAAGNAANTSVNNGIIIVFDGKNHTLKSPKIKGCNKLAPITSASIPNCSGGNVHVNYQTSGGNGFFSFAGTNLDIPPFNDENIGYTYSHALGYKDSVMVTYTATGDSIVSVQGTFKIIEQPIIEGSYCASTSSITVQTTGDSTNKALLVTKGTTKPSVSLLNGKDTSSLASNTLLGGSTYYFNMGTSQSFTISNLVNSSLLSNTSYSISAVHYSGSTFVLDTSFTTTVSTATTYPIAVPTQGIANAAITAANTSNTSALLTFTPGNGNQRLILVQQGGSPSAPASGPNPDNEGMYIADLEATLSGLTPSTQYFVTIIELNQDPKICEEYYSYNTTNVGYVSFKTTSTENFGTKAPNNLTVSTALAGISGAYNNVTIASGGHATLSANVTGTGALTVQSGGVLDLNGHTMSAQSITIEDGGIVLETNSTGGTGFGSAPVLVQRSASPSQYSYLATPVSAGSAGGSVNYYYSESTRTKGNFETGWDTLTGSMAPGVGYACLKPGSASSFNGTLNNGTITTSVSHTSIDNSSTTDGWNLLGNPYPSPVDVSSFLSANSSSLASGVYCWNGSNYTTLNSGNIPVAQGFFVHAQSTGSVTFNNTMRNSGTNTLYRLANVTQKINLTLSSNLNQDQLQIELRDSALDSFEPYLDALKLKVSTANEFYAFTTPDKQPVAIDILANDGNDKTIPLGLNVAKGGTFNLSLKDNSLANYSGILLKDSVTGTLVDLTQSSYTFTASQSANLRLALLLTNNAVTGLTAPTVDKVLVYTIPGAILVNSHGKETQIRVIDMMGKVYYQGISNGNLVTIPALANNLYIVQTQTAAGIDVQKVIVY